MSQKDEIWGVGTSGLIYHFNYGTKTFNRVAGSLVQIVVGEGIWDNCHPYEVWGLNAADWIFRYNYCTKVFEQLPGTLTHIATGGGSVWGLNASALIYYFDFVSQNFLEAPGTLQQIAVGPNDVWGLDGSGNIYHYENSSGEFLGYGIGLPANLLAAGGDGTWVTTNADDGAWILASASPSIGSIRYGGTTFVQIAVGSGAGFWGVNELNELYTFVRP